MKRINFLLRLALILSLMTNPGFAFEFEEESNKKPAGSEEETLNQPGSFPQAKEPEYAPGRIIVKFKPHAGEELYQAEYKTQGLQAGDSRLKSIDNLNAKYKVEKIQPLFKGLHKKGLPGQQLMKARSQAHAVAQKFPQRQKRAPKNAKVPDLENIYILEIEKDADILQAVAEYRNDPNVEYAEPDYIYQINYIPNDEDYSKQWAHKKIMSEQTWDIQRGSPDIVIAIIDTGVDYTHPDLAENIWVNEDEIPNNGIDDDENGYVDDVRGYDFVTVSENYVYEGEDPGPADNDPMDIQGHGTHIAGIAAARSG